ncbi:CAX-interacting protein 4-like [Iris pallida]|uniref:CAX-interacting protein 4-like n=1 Tax=Iris pallida TaxID=29817 RepID=A0AAX6HMP6_IRIPA|nr:CAX-interacting protein 4-like [Iris pallida]
MLVPFDELRSQSDSRVRHCMYILWILIDNFFFSFLLFVVEGSSACWTSVRLDCGCTYLFVSDVRVGYEVARTRG